MKNRTIKPLVERLFEGSVNLNTIRYERSVSGHPRMAWNASFFHAASNRKWN